MCIIEELNKTALRMVGLIAIFAISILHIVIGFRRSVPDFYTYDLFNLSPIYDFSIDYSCNNKQSKVFHKWGGWKQWEYDSLEKKYEFKFYDMTDIQKVNGKYFCYNEAKLTYMDLLRNGQIIKNGTQCPEEYKKKCGRIDTLNQELCIKENDKCPLFDVGIGYQPDKDNYEYDADSDIYYSKENFTVSNKTIVAQFILSDGQPCYHSNETLWRRFSLYETDPSYLVCTKIEVFGKKNDDRFKKTGQITYKKLYQDNLSNRAKEKVMDFINNENVSLFTREFFGIDRECDANFNSTDDFSIIKKTQNADKIIEVLQGFLMAGASLIFFGMEIFTCKNNEEFPIPSKVYFGLYMAYIIISCGFLASKIIAYIRAKNYGITEDYNCSDSITNEVIRKGNENNKNIFTYNKICLFSEVAILGANFLVIIIGLFCSIFNNLTVKYEKNSSDDGYTPAPHVEIPDTNANYPSYPTDN